MPMTFETKCLEDQMVLRVVGNMRWLAMATAIVTTVMMIIAAAVVPFVQFLTETASSQLIH